MESGKYMNKDVLASAEAEAPLDYESVVHSIIYDPKSKIVYISHTKLKPFINTSYITKAVINTENSNVFITDNLVFENQRLAKIAILQNDDVTKYDDIIATTDDGKLLVIHAKNPKHLSQIHVQRHGKEPKLSDVAVCNGKIYATDKDNNCAYYLKRDGTIELVFGEHELNSPREISCYANGDKICIKDPNGIKVFDFEGNCLKSVDEPGNATVGLSVDNEGNILSTNDTGSNRFIQIYDQNLSLITRYEDGLSCIRSACFLPHGHVIILDQTKSGKSVIKLY